MPNKSIVVKIDIFDHVKFTIVTSVIDNPHVRNFIFELRERYKIKTFYNPNGEEAKKGFSDEHLEDLRNTIMEFREKLGLDPVFDTVLLTAAIYNKVTEKDFKTAFLNIKNFSSRFSDPHYWIDITPYTTWDDLRAAFREFKSMLKIARTTNKWKGYLPTISKKLPSDKSEIKRDRKWYWQYKAGKTPLEISKAAPGRNSTDPYDYRDSFVNKALNRYKKLIGDIAK